MQTTERPPTPTSRGTSPARGVLLVAVAVIVGVFVLRALDDTGAGPEVDVVDEATGQTDAPPPEEGGEQPPPEGEEEQPAPRPPQEITVLVANASGVSGAAAAQTDAIAGGGYQTVEPTNAPEHLESTQILAVPGFEAEAAALAAAIGAPEGAVQPMPDPPPLETQGAQLVVLLGPDLASG
ncbi:MAG TPA: LytR C-terminal domain-containing protein [Acidimicrobiales bacterium]|jgi:hypothetical protein|nr:LytR C-terminal domain-containing protein [Acidimicrobiales bacterium]